MKMVMQDVRSVELRKANRYQMSATVFFFWMNKNEPEQYGQGVTRDINPSGVYVLANALPPAGAQILMDILLPKLSQAGKGMHMTGEGVVLRVEPSGNNSAGAKVGGFAASVQFYPEKTELVLEHFKATGGVV